MLLKKYLEIEPKARERSNKNRAIGNLLIENYFLKIDKATMQEIVGEVLSLDRQWRKLLEENPELRGKDYDDKDKLSQEKQVSLGYESGFNQFKNLSTE